MSENMFMPFSYVNNWSEYTWYLSIPRVTQWQSMLSPNWQTLTLFENRVILDTVRLKWGHTIRWACWFILTCIIRSRSWGSPDGCTGQEWSGPASKPGTARSQEQARKDSQSFLREQGPPNTCFRLPNGDKYLWFLRSPLFNSLWWQF